MIVHFRGQRLRCCSSISLFMSLISGNKLFSHSTTAAAGFASDWLPVVVTFPRCGGLIAADFFCVYVFLSPTRCLTFVSVTGRCNSRLPQLRRQLRPRQLLWLEIYLDQAQLEG